MGFKDIELPTFCPEDIRETWDEVNRIFDGEHHETKTRWFFKSVLQGFYSPMSAGMKSDAGHVIYRLSDHLTGEERRGIQVYGNDTLEDWRKQWEKYHPIIPILTVKLLT